MPNCSACASPSAWRSAPTATTRAGYSALCAASSNARRLEPPPEMRTTTRSTRTAYRSVHVVKRCSVCRRAAAIVGAGGEALQRSAGGATTQERRDGRRGETERETDRELERRGETHRERIRSDVVEAARAQRARRRRQEPPEEHAPGRTADERDGRRPGERRSVARRAHEGRPHRRRRQGRGDDRHREPHIAERELARGQRAEQRNRRQ